MTEGQSLPVRLGHDFLRHFYHVLHSARIYRDDNQLIQKSVKSFQSILTDMTVAGDIALVLWRGRFHFGGEKLPYRRDAAGVVGSMLEFFSHRRIGSMEFLQSAKHASRDDLLMFVRLLNDVGTGRENLERFSQKLHKSGLTWVKVFEKLPDDLSGEDLQDEDRIHENARNTYFHAVETVREVAKKASQGMVGVRKARRLAQNIVDLIREDSALMIGLTTIKDHDDYTYTHSVNVALLATCLGRHIGLSDLSLEYLSVCALFHDLGKVGIPREILNKQAGLTEEEWEQMKAHPLIGVRQVLGLNAPEALRSRIILGPFEHHLNPDMTGYPRTLFMEKLSLTGKILRIADVYEALTAQRAYRQRSYAPDEALRKMWLESGKSFDPILLKRFIGMMGVYPIGSLVELSDGGIALVMDYPAESERALPLVMRLVREGDAGWRRGGIVYLPDQESSERVEKLSIVRGLSPVHLGINPAAFFLHEQ